MSMVSGILSARGHGNFRAGKSEEPCGRRACVSAAGRPPRSADSFHPFMFESMLYFIRPYRRGVPAPAQRAGINLARQQRLRITTYDQYRVRATLVGDLELFDLRPRHPLVGATPGAYKHAVIPDTDPIAEREVAEGDTGNSKQTESTQRYSRDQEPAGPQDRSQREDTGPARCDSPKEEPGDRIDPPVPVLDRSTRRIRHIRNCAMSCTGPARLLDTSSATAGARPQLPRGSHSSYGQNQAGGSSFEVS
jgi:hypothetical protein